MLGARRIPQRIKSWPWLAEPIWPTRLYTTPARTEWPRARSKQQSQNRHAEKQDTGAPKRPPLIEQLFPQETKRYESREKTPRVVPRLPLDLPTPSGPVRHLKKDVEKQVQGKSWMAMRMEEEMRSQGQKDAILVLRNATKNLTEEDFRRLIPQGRHIEGWTLQEGDILRVVPGRDMANLAHENYYYIIFSSPLSAYTYQGHVTRIHRLAAAHTPRSLSDTIPPPPGWMAEGLDVHAAIQSYTLVPPNQKLELRQLRSPLSPTMASIVRYGQYRAIAKRPGKLPFEARLTMDGPQLQPSKIRHIMMQTGKERGLSWSGGDNYDLQITRWEDKSVYSPIDDDTGSPGEEVREAKEANEATVVDAEKEKAKQLDSLGLLESAAKVTDAKKEQRRRTSPLVYTVGFHTEHAAQTFVTHWHRRPLDAGKEQEETMDGDQPPIANVDMLW